MNLLKKNSNKILLGLFLCSLVVICIYISPMIMTFDENYTLTLVHHSYNQLIYFDSKDVHPILYYILLKIFMTSTTSEIINPTIKIIDARVFSFILSIFVFIILRAILRNLHIYNNMIIEWLCFLSLPGILNSSIMGSQLTNIRMYSLSMLFIVAEFYFLLKYNITNNNFYLLLATISAVLASYTHYYSAIFSGLLILAYLFKNLISLNKNQLKKYIISECVLILCFIPWLPIFILQIKNSNTYWMTFPYEFKEIRNFLILVIIFFYPIYKFYEKTNHSDLFRIQLFDFCFTAITSFILILIFVLIKGPVFQSRYMISLFIIYEFISVNIIIKYLFNKKINVIFVIIMLVLVLTDVKSFMTQIKLDSSSIRVEREYIPYHHSRHNIYIDSACKNKFYCTNIMSYMLYTHNYRLIISKRYKKLFKHNVHIFYNSMYKQLFQNEISKFKYKN